MDTITWNAHIITVPESNRCFSSECLDRGKWHVSPSFFDECPTLQTKCPKPTRVKVLTVCGLPIEQMVGSLLFPNRAVSSIPTHTFLLREAIRVGKQLNLQHMNFLTDESQLTRDDEFEGEILSTEYPNFAFVRDMHERCRLVEMDAVDGRWKPTLYPHDHPSFPQVDRFRLFLKEKEPRKR